MSRVFLTDFKCSLHIFMICFPKNICKTLGGKFNRCLYSSNDTVQWKIQGHLLTFIMLHCKTLWLLQMEWLQLVCHKLCSYNLEKYQGLLQQLPGNITLGVNDCSVFCQVRCSYWWHLVAMCKGIIREKLESTSLTKILP